MVVVKMEDGTKRYIILKYYKHYTSEDGIIVVEFPRGLTGMVFDEHMQETERIFKEAVRRIEREAQEKLDNLTNELIDDFYEWLK